MKQNNPRNDSEENYSKSNDIDDSNEESDDSSGDGIILDKHQVQHHDSTTDDNELPGHRLFPLPSSKNRQLIG